MKTRLSTCHTNDSY